jgi:type IV fimbrial biogenesis protein FimT
MLINFTIKTSMNKTQNGFTLIELLITLAVVAIAIAIGTSSLQRITESNRGAAQNNLIMGSLTTARSEAIKRGMNVALCVSTDSTSATPTCSPASTKWELGWILFADNNKDNKYVSADGDILLGVSAPLTGGLTLRAIDNTNASLNTISFQPNGGTTTSDTFKICTQDADLKKARAINVLPSGLINIAKDIDATPDSIVNDVTGNNVTCP